MKKFILTISLILLGTFAFAETYTLPTSQGDKELYIPDDSEELREAYIEMASLYLEERFDLEESLEHSKSLLGIHDDYKTYYEKLEDSTQDLIRELSKPEDIDLFRIYWVGGYRYDFLSPWFNVSLGIQLQILESIIIGLSYEVPTSVRITISERF
jgi:hypothetical protein